MTPIPIFIPSAPLSNLNIVYPYWVEVIGRLSLAICGIGCIWALIILCLSFVDDRIDICEKPHTYAMALMIFGMIMIIISLVLVMLTGQEIN